MLFLCEHGCSSGDDVDKTVYMRGMAAGKAEYFGLYHPSFAAAGAPTAAVQSTAADPKQQGERWKAPVGRFPALPLLFRRAFHARSAFSFPLQCPKSQIVSGFVPQQNKKAEPSGFCIFSDPRNAASGARTFGRRMRSLWNQRSYRVKGA